MADQRSVLKVVATGKYTFKILCNGPDGLRTLRVTSIAKLKKQLEPNLCVDELRFSEKAVMNRKLLEALQGMTVEEYCTVPASFESAEVFKAFLNVIAKTENIKLTATLPVFEDLRDLDPFIACRCLDFGGEINACDQMGWTKENIVQWLYLTHQWEQGVRRMTIRVEPKQAAEIAQHVVKEFDSDKESRAFELVIRTTSSAFNMLQHMAINAVTGDFIYTRGFVEGVHIKRHGRSYVGMPSAANFVSAKILQDLLQNILE